jgi:hypothetical protein
MGATSASAAPTWLAPEDISAPNHSITFPDIAVDAAGNAVGIWPRDSGSKTIIEVAERPAGGDWSAPVALSDPSEDEEPSSAHIGLDAAGDAVAVWGAFGAHGDVVRTAVRPAGGDWSDAEDLSVASGRGPWLAMNAAGDAVAVWSGFNGISAEVTWAATWSPGSGWSAPEDLSVAGEQDGFYPRVAIDPSGDAIAVWERQGLGEDIVRAATWSAGSGWSVPEDLSVAGVYSRAPRIAMNTGGDAVAAWTVLSNGGVKAAVRPAGGGWSAPEDVSSAGEGPGEAEVAIDSSGSAFAIWPNYASGEPTMRAATRPAGGPWAPPEGISTEANAFQSYDLEVNAAAGVVATWTRDDGSGHRVQAAVRPPGGGWAAPDDLSLPGENSGLPELGFDEAGNAVAIWGREVGAHDYVLQGAGYDFTGPRLDGLQIPATGTAGAPVSFAVSPFDVFSLGATSWAFGDGSQASGGDAVSHIYAAPGTYPVTVTAFDASGNASTQTRAITIAAGPPKPPPPRRPIELSLRVEGESLRKLLRSGTLSVDASVNEAASVALSGQAKLRVRSRSGARTRLVSVFAPKTVRFAAAVEERVTLALSKRGRKALQNLSRVRLLIAGEARDDVGGIATKTLAHTLR